MIAVPQKVLPTHVRACRHSPDASQRWFVWTWNRAAPEEKHRVPYSCNSWRCEVCARHEAAVTFRRITEACEGLDPRGWCYFVLTVDRNAFFGGKKWVDATDCYRQLGTMSEKFRKRLRRMYPEIGNKWVAVVEAHRSGWPHLNLMVHSPNLAAHLRASRAEKVADPAVAEALEYCRQAWRDRSWVPREIQERARGPMLLDGDLLRHATETDWGRQSTGEAARDHEALAGYITKLCANHDASVGEVAKITQAPTNAPERFRRLRAGKKFLPPRHHNAAVTGCLVRRRRIPGAWVVMPMNPPKEPEQQEHVDAAKAAEFQVLLQEAQAMKDRRAAPHLRVAIGRDLVPSSEEQRKRWLARRHAEQVMAEEMERRIAWVKHVTAQARAG